MSGRPNPVGDAAVLAAITRAAKARMPCPSNAALTAMLGGRSHSAGSAAIDRLARRGVIEVERFVNSRIVTIVSSGLRTAGAPGTPIRRAGNVPVGIDRQPQSAPRASQAAGIPAAEPELVRVDREPCTWCGTRADIGCKHNRAPVAAPSSDQSFTHVAAQ